MIKLITHPSGYEPHATSSILIRWRTIGRRFIPQTKNLLQKIHGLYNTTPMHLRGRCMGGAKNSIIMCVRLITLPVPPSFRVGDRELG